MHPEWGTINRALFSWHPRTQLKGKLGPKDLGFFWLKQHLKHSRGRIQRHNSEQFKPGTCFFWRSQSWSWWIHSLTASINLKDASKWKLSLAQALGLIREQEFYICHSPAFSGITQSFYCVSKRRSICGISVFGNKIDLYEFLCRLLGQGSNCNYTDMCRKQCPSLVLNDEPVTNGNILPYSTYIPIPQKSFCCLWPETVIWPSQ